MFVIFMVILLSATRLRPAGHSAVSGLRPEAFAPVLLYARC